MLSKISFHIHFKKFNKSTLKCCLGAVCRFQGGRYTHAALETVYDHLTIRQVFKTIGSLRSLELPYTRSTLRVGFPDVWLKAVC